MASERSRQDSSPKMDELFDMSYFSETKTGTMTNSVSQLVGREEKGACLINR